MKLDNEDEIHELDQKEMYNHTGIKERREIQIEAIKEKPKRNVLDV